MKFWLVFLIFILGIFFIASGVIFYFHLIDLKKLSVSSPLSQVVYTTQTQLSGKKNTRWQAKGIISSGMTAPENKAKAVLLIDLNSEKIIYDKNAEEQLPIASLSKLMTATVALQTTSLDKTYIVTKEATSCGEAVMGLSDNESCNVRELIYGLILPSGNDAAEILARNIPPEGREKFINWMNQKAKNLGMSKSQFFNPHGLDEENGQTNLSSAGDLAALFYYLKEYFPFFIKVLKSREYEAAGFGHKRLYLYNTSWDFTRSYPYLTGGKSGNTGKAGFCLLALAEKNRHQLLLIILGEPTYNDIRLDSWKLFDYGFEVLSAAGGS
jgi:D-alanyl-D-alanine carboxypeptidase (penicillin-binding protein 5/6)